MTLRLLGACAFLFVVLSSGYGWDKKQTRSSLPAEGVIPDEVTAVKIAEAILPPVFGDEEVSKYKPYHATLREGIWTVYGTLKPNARGGTPMLSVQKIDAKVIEIWHSQ